MNSSRCDMIDVIATFVDRASTYLGETDNARVDNKFVQGLQDFVPENNRYDCIWVQWVSGHLTDDDFVAFFARCTVSCDSTSAF